MTRAWCRCRFLPLTVGLAFVILTAIVVRVASQEPPVGVTELERRIGELRQQIDEAEARITRLRADEESQTELLEQLGQQISAAEQLINALTRQIRARSTEADRLRREIEALGGEIDRLQEVVAAYIVGLYTHGRRRLVQTVLEGGRFNDMIRRLKGVSIIARRQSEDVERLGRVRADRVEMNRQITRTLRQLEESRTAQHRTRTDLQTARAEAEEILTVIRQDQEQTRTLMQRQQAELAELIQRLQAEQERLRRQGRAASGPIGGFPDMRGRLPWPLSSPRGRGEIVLGFGRHVGRDRTVTHNPGIDILAPPGSDASIVATHNGIVIHIGWMTFLGTIIVLDHGDGYATVYTNATDPNPAVGEWVGAGFPMALLGTDMTPASGEIEALSGITQPRLLRFIIYSAGDAVDPAPWLGGY